MISVSKINGESVLPQFEITGADVAKLRGKVENALKLKYVEQCTLLHGDKTLEDSMQLSEFENSAIITAIIGEDEQKKKKLEEWQSKFLQDGGTTIDIYGNGGANADRILHAILEEIGNDCKNINKITLTCSFVTDTGTKEIANSCTELKVLYLSQTRVSDAGVQQLARNCSKLTEINLYRCRYITDVGVTEIARHCSNLHSINVHSCSGVTDVGVTAISENCKDLKEINLRGSEATEACIPQLCNACPQLQTVVVPGVPSKELTAAFPHIKMR